MSEPLKPMNYDPNLCFSGNMAKQRVRLTFGCWDYRAVLEVEAGGNCLGFSVIEHAVERAFEQLEGESVPRIVLSRADGSSLECEDDEDRGGEWLKDMLLAAEIVSIEPDLSATRRWQGG